MWYFDGYKRNLVHRHELLFVSINRLSHVMNLIWRDHLGEVFITVIL